MSYDIIGARHVEPMKRPRRGAPLLTAEEVRTALVYDPDTGKFVWRSRPDVRPQWNGRYAGKPAGILGNRGYAILNIHAKHYLAHRVAWLYMTGGWPAAEVDHINNIRDDNRWCNLRQASHSENNFNKPMDGRNKCGHRGVVFYQNRRVWAAFIKINGKSRCVGSFDSAEAASNAYRAAACDLFGEFAKGSVPFAPASA